MQAQMPSRFKIFFSYNIMRAQRLLYRWLRNITGNTRPTSFPYVTGDNFRAIADHVHDESGRTFKPEDVKVGDTVFVCNGYAHEYMRTIHQKITNRYVLIVHNGDQAMDQEFVDMLDDKIEWCYAQELTADHPKVTAIGIAIENRHYHSAGIVHILNRIIRKMKKNPPAKKDKILYRFSVHTNPQERGPMLELFKSLEYMETFTEMLPPPLYFKYLMTYKFVVSPPGHAIESCRTWEALEVRTIPIVKDFVAYRHFVKMGLPMWIVKDWNELTGLNEKMLAEKYEEMMKNVNWAPIRMDYWIKRIREDQARARAH